MKKEINENCVTDGCVRGEDGIVEAKLVSLGAISDSLGEILGRAVADSKQFNRYIVSEKEVTPDKTTVTKSVEREFEKVDFRSVREAASALKALAETVKTVYSADGVSECDENGDMSNIVVTLGDAGEYAE